MIPLRHTYTINISQQIHTSRRISHVLLVLRSTYDTYATNKPKKVLSISFLTVKVKLVVTIVSEVLSPVKGRQTEEALNALQDWQRVLYELVTVQDQDVLLVDNYMEIFLP